MNSWRRKTILTLALLLLLAVAPLAVAQDITVPNDLADAPPPETLSPSLLLQTTDEATGAVAANPGLFPTWLLITLGVVGGVFLVCTLSMLVHAITKPIHKKALWIVLLVLFGPIVAPIYFFTGRKSAEEAYLNMAPQAPVPYGTGQAPSASLGQAPPIPTTGSAVSLPAILSTGAGLPATPQTWQPTGVLTPIAAVPVAAPPNVGSPLTQEGVMLGSVAADASAVPPPPVFSTPPLSSQPVVPVPPQPPPIPQPPFLIAQSSPPIQPVVPLAMPTAPAAPSNAAAPVAQPVAPPPTSLPPNST